MNAQKIFYCIDQAYKNALAHGFYDHTSQNHEIMMIITECAEAVQADRHGKHADMAEYLRLNEIGEIFDVSYHQCIADTFEDEVADIFLRLFSYMGRYELSIELSEWNHTLYNGTVPEMMLQIISTLMARNITATLTLLFQFALKNHIPIDDFIDIKMQFNKLRPYGHNVKY